MVPLHKVRFLIYIKEFFQLWNCLYYTVTYLPMVNIYNIWVNVWSEFAKSSSSINSEIIQTVFSLQSTFTNIYVCVYVCACFTSFFPQLACQLYPLSYCVKSILSQSLLVHHSFMSLLILWKSSEFYLN